VADKGLPISTGRVAGVEPMPTRAKNSLVYSCNFSAKNCSLRQNKNVDKGLFTLNSARDLFWRQDFLKRLSNQRVVSLQILCHLSMNLSHIFF
jgi:hypothetical protein